MRIRILCRISRGRKLIKEFITIIHSRLSVHARIRSAVCFINPHVFRRRSEQERKKNRERLVTLCARYRRRGIELPSRKIETSSFTHAIQPSPSFPWMKRARRIRGSHVRNTGPTFISRNELARSERCVTTRCVCADNADMLIATASSRSLDASWLSFTILFPFPPYFTRRAASSRIRPRKLDCSLDAPRVRVNKTEETDGRDLEVFYKKR